MIALLPAVLCLLFMGHLLPAINPRLGSIAEVFRLEGAHPENAGEIWLSVAPLDDNTIVVTTSDRKVFPLPSSIGSVSELKAFVRYLRSRVDAVTISVGLQEALTSVQTCAVIAADERLKYEHIRPLLYALAQARIHKYSFEVRTI